MPIQITQHQKNLIILDIDGCVVDSEARLPLLFVDGVVSPDRKVYDDAHPTDKTIPAGQHVYKLLNAFSECTVLFVTGRSEVTREYTMAQLNHALGEHPAVEERHLLMRPLGCENEHDTVLKPRLIEEAGYSLDQILLVIEDRDSTVAMWRERGITCWQSQPGAF